MEFWGREVKPRATVSCEAGDGFVIHLSQAALGKTKKESENVIVFVKVGDKKLVLGTLSADKHPQISCDLIFDEDFELSHNSKTASVFLCGYKSVMPDMFESDSGEDEGEEMETDEIPVKNIGTKKATANAKVPVKDGEKEKQDNDNDNDSETSSGTDGLSASDSEDGFSDISGDDSEDDSEDDTSSGTDDISGDDSEDDSEDDSDDEETPVPEVGKKRAAATALKTPASDKKAKISTPKETGDKKSVHVATPHPAKQASKTPAEGKLKEKAPKTPAEGKLKEKAPKTPADDKPKKGPKTPADSKAKEKSPKSGSHSCKSCSKTFNSAGALESHQKAKKHEA